MTDTLTQRLLAAVLDNQALDDALVRDLALSSDAHGELVRLATVLARLPGDGARAAEVRLDRLLDDVALVVAGESQIPSLRAEAIPLSDAANAERLSIRTIKRVALGGIAIAAAAVVIAVVWSSNDAGVATPPPVAKPAMPAMRDWSVNPERPEASRSPAVRPLVNVEIRVTPANATIAIDGVTVNGNPVVGQYRSDDGFHRIDAKAPGYISKEIDVTVDVRLERAAVVAVGPRAPVRAKVSGSPARVVESPRLPRDVKSPFSDESQPAMLPATPPAVALQPPPKRAFGTVIITTDPRDSTILIDGARVTTPQGEPHRIAAGQHQVTVMAAGYMAEIRTIDVPAGGIVQFEASLRASRVDAASGGKRSVRPLVDIDPYGVDATRSQRP
jgi:hypothetical protein